MTQRIEHRYKVTFTASQAPDGRPIIALVLDQDGETAAGQGSVFFLDVDQTIARDGIDRIATLLSQYVKGFGVMIRNPEKTEDQRERDDGNGTSAPPPEVLAEDATQRDEPEPNLEEEGQPSPPPQIDSVKEAEVDEPQSQDEG